MIPEISLWQPLSAELSINDSELHLWRFSLHSDLPSVAQVKKYLSLEELLRAERLIDKSKAEKFIIARFYLRTILGKYLHLALQDIQFSYNSHGKPFLEETSIRFNLSHSDQQAVLAITKGGDVGVDLEKNDPALNYETVSDQFFTLREQQQLEQYPQHKKRRGFYRLWTRKEAMLKCLGCGFQGVREYTPADSWIIRSFPLKRHFICSCAVQHEITKIMRMMAPDLVELLSFETRRIQRF